MAGGAQTWTPGSIAQLAGRMVDTGLVTAGDVEGYQAWLRTGRAITLLP
jgi:hypothetical protein